VVVNSGQHQDEVARVLADFGLYADEVLADQRGLALSEMTASLLGHLSRSVSIASAGLVLVQGDTTTAFAAGLAAFHRRIPVAHLEAGLRSGILETPFPEEAHRRLLAVLASIHLAPTDVAHRNLRAMGIAAGKIAVTGNTSVDALKSLAAATSAGIRRDLGLGDGRIVLVTLHRRESWAEGLAHVCEGIVSALRSVPDAVVVVPVHGNPRVRQIVHDRFAGLRQVRLLEPLPYRRFVACLQAADVVVTDSGGVQEEAVTLGKQTLIVRTVTDRPEAVDAGVARLVGTAAVDVARALRAALQRSAASVPADVYGDGRAAERVLIALNRWRLGLQPLLPREFEFHASAPAERRAAG
jgi:UDP-N-acetylglucosamine 2-epimerase (non-hydrolysing)